MIRVTDWAKRILDFAIAKEEAAELFYLHWSERCDSEEIKRLLKQLATEERVHIEKLSRVSPETLIAEGIAPAEFGLVRDLPEDPAEQDMTVLDVLSIAIKREEKAINLYDRMRGASTSEEKLFAALVEEERRHKHLLELEYALLKSRMDRE